MIERGLYSAEMRGDGGGWLGMQPKCAWSCGTCAILAVTSC